MIQCVDGVLELRNISGLPAQYRIRDDDVVPLARHVDADVAFGVAVAVSAALEMEVEVLVEIPSGLL